MNNELPENMVVVLELAPKLAAGTIVRVVTQGCRNTVARVKFVVESEMVNNCIIFRVEVVLVSIGTTNASVVTAPLNVKLKR